MLSYVKAASDMAFAQFAKQQETNENAIWGMLNMTLLGQKVTGIMMDYVLWVHQMETSIADSLQQIVRWNLRFARLLGEQ